MFYLTEAEDHIRVDPRHFGLPTMEAVEKQLNESYVDNVSKDLGFVISVVSVDMVGDGIIIPGDGAAYYNSKFKLIVWKPELQELVYGVVEEITNLGAFINLGVMKGIIHISQTMDDYVSFSKTNTLVGKSNKRTLKKGDKCIARVVALSYKGDQLKIGLTMRQPGLGKIEWVEEDKKKAIADAKKALKIQAKGVKKK